MGTIQSLANSIGNWIKIRIYKHLPVLKPVDTILLLLTNTEAKHLDFSRYMRRLEGWATEIDGKTKYFDFDMPIDTEYTNMAENAKMPRLTAIMQEWLASLILSDYVESCARLSANKTSSKQARQQCSEVTAQKISSRTKVTVPSAQRLLPWIYNAKTPGRSHWNSQRHDRPMCARNEIRMPLHPILWPKL